MITEHSRYTTFTEATFQSDVLDGCQAVLVDFWAEW
jgi:thioredoxin-like negative regulator of GroEL